MSLYSQPGSVAKRVVFVVPPIVALVFALSFGQGMRGTDDLGYAQVAMSGLRGEHSPPLFYQPDFHDGRLGAIAPLGAAFWLFGPGDFSMAVLPLVCTVLTALLVAWLGYRVWGPTCGLVAGLLYASLPLTIDLSTFYTPEPLATLEMSLAGALVVIAIDRQQRAAYFEFFAGLVIGLAYLTTEVGALMLPALYLYLWLSGKLRPRDAWLAAGFALVLGSELIYHAIVNGNAFHRFALGQAFAEDPLVQGANRDLMYRLFKAYPALFVYPNSDFALSGFLMVVGGLYGLVRWREGSLFVVWAAIVLLFYNFMSGSLTQYVVTPVAARHVAPACVPLMVLSAKFLVDVWGWGFKTARAAAIRYGLAALYLAGATGLAVGSLVVMYLNTVPTLTAAIAQNAKLVARFLEQQPSATVVTDRTSARAIQFYRASRPGDTFLMFDMVAAGDQGSGNDLSKPVFVVVNGPVLNEPQITGERYGGRLSLSDTDRQVLERLTAEAQAEVFSSRFPSGRYVDDLLRVRVARYLLGPYRHRLNQMLLTEDPPLAQVRVYRAGTLRADSPSLPQVSGSFGAPSDERE